MLSIHNDDFNVMIALYSCCNESGPNAATLSDFIQMIWDQKSQVVVMLTHFVEMGKV